MRHVAEFLKGTQRWFGRFSYGGLVVGVVFFCFSLMPSLLPRPWLFQGIVSGISLAIGYGLGTAISSLVRWLTEYELSGGIKRNFWRVLALVDTGLALIFLYSSFGWQNSVRQLVNEDPLNNGHSTLVLLTALLLAIILINIARGVRLIGRFLQRQFDRILPRRIGYALTGLIVAALFFWIISGVFINFFISSANQAFASRNNTTAAGITQPTGSLRSGGQGTLTPWKTLGYQGRSFVGSGPNAAQLANFNNRPAMEPIRVYAGLKSAKGPEARAQLAVKELVRTGAFKRKLLVIANTTGTGWLEPQAVDSLEYMWNGNTAIVGQQYSYLPSWISFLVDKENATDTGLALFDAVYGQWLTLPDDQRPQLYAYGLSLGSFGGQAAYSGVNSLRNSLSGALFIGTPNDTRLWQTVTKNRDNGSPEWQPVYKSGKAVQFAANNSQISKSQNNWKSPRILYVQHGSDPIVWFNFDLLFHKPDWLNEKRAPDVSSAVRWYPIVTFWQLTIDQLFGVDVPAGHGHNYTNTAASSWAAVTRPADWTNADTIRLQKIINTYPSE